MRHNASARKLGRTTSHRLSLFRNQLASLVANERIVTTLAKAKELRPLAERMVTQGRRDSVHARRMVGRWIPSRDLVKKLFDEIAPRFVSRPGGYLRIVKLGSRQGDGAELAILEFVDFVHKKTVQAPPASEEKGKKKGAPAETEAAEQVEEAAEEAGMPAKGKKKAAASKTKAPKATKTSAKQEAKASVKAKTHAGKTPKSTRKSSAPKKSGGA